MELVIAEKPSVAQSIAAVLGATQRKDGYLEGNEYLVSWCVGHLVELVQPESYEEAWKKWSYDNLPIIPHTMIPDSHCLPNNRPYAVWHQELPQCSVPRSASLQLQAPSLFLPVFFIIIVVTVIFTVILACVL